MPPFYYDPSSKPFVVKRKRKEVSTTFQFWLRASFCLAIAIVAVILAYNAMGVKGEHVHGIKDLPF